MKRTIEVIVSLTHRVETFLQLVCDRDFSGIVDRFPQDELCELLSVNCTYYYNDLVPPYVFELRLTSLFGREFEVERNGGECRVCFGTFGSFDSSRLLNFLNASTSNLPNICEIRMSLCSLAH